MNLGEIKKLIFWGAVILLIGLVFRAPSDLQDGLSERAFHVGWWAWHLFGWAARDLWQFLFVFGASVYICIRLQITGKTAVTFIGVSLALNAVISFYLHNRIYWWAISHRYWFDW